MRRHLLLCAVLPLAACGSFTTPAAVRLADGTTMIGTTTAAISGGHFEVATADQSLTCSGTYDALDTTPTISVPVICSDGRYGRATVTRARDGLSGRGTVEVSDGQIGQVAFGNNAGLVLQPPPATQPSVAAAEPPLIDRTYYPPPPVSAVAMPAHGASGRTSYPSTAPSATSSSSARLSSRPRATQPVRSSSRSGYIRGPRGGCYYINRNGNKTYVDRSLC